MKIRLGMVSNSSTSSFVVVGYGIDNKMFSREKIMEAVWGNESDFPKKEPSEKKRGCVHPETKGARFCPECGKPTWVDSFKHAEDKFADELSDYYYEKRGTGDGFTIRDDDDDGAPNGKTVVGIEAACWSDDGDSAECECDLEDIFGKLKDLRSRLGLSDEEQIKLFVGTCAS